jgi:hypothetical protein
MKKIRAGSPTLVNPAWNTARETDAAGAYKPVPAIAPGVYCASVRTLNIVALNASP